MEPLERHERVDNLSWHRMLGSNIVNEIRGAVVTENETTDTLMEIPMRYRIFSHAENNFILLVGGYLRV